MESFLMAFNYSFLTSPSCAIIDINDIFSDSSWFDCYRFTCWVNIHFCFTTSSSMKAFSRIFLKQILTWDFALNICSFKFHIASYWKAATNPLLSFVIYFPSNIIKREQFGKLNGAVKSISVKVCFRILLAHHLKGHEA